MFRLNAQPLQIIYSARFKNKENIIITNMKNCIDEFDKEFNNLWAAF